MKVNKMSKQQCLMLSHELVQNCAINLQAVGAALMASGTTPGLLGPTYELIREARCILSETESALVSIEDKEAYWK